ERRRGGERLAQASGGVMIRDRQAADAVPMRQPHQLGWGQPAVRAGGVGVQVNLAGRGHVRLVPPLSYFARTRALRRRATPPPLSRTRAAKEGAQQERHAWCTRSLPPGWE